MMMMTIWDHHHHDPHNIYFIKTSDKPHRLTLKVLKVIELFKNSKKLQIKQK